MVPVSHCSTNPKVDNYYMNISFPIRKKKKKNRDLSETDLHLFREVEDLL